ncbi:MAG: polyprenyl synthetase family protein [Armatimonadota bacterium]
MSVDLIAALRERDKKVTEYFLNPRYRERFRPQNLREAVFAYLERPAKRLRPAVMMWSCGAVGGDEEVVIPAAAGVEMFHTWTLVHDDLIDNDDLRRGGPTVHKLGETFASEKLGYDEFKSREYGRNLAVLTGDSQHGFTVSLFCECARSGRLDPRVVLDVIHYLETRVVNTLIEGEILDVQYSQMPVEQLTQDDIVRMLWMKTGVLYEFAAGAGAMLGLNTSDPEHPWVAALSRFAGRCGTAFQLQDDILGLVGKQEQLGKPIGSDLREGKRTTIVLFAFESADIAQKKFLASVLGNKQVSAGEIEKARQTMISLGAVERTAKLAMEHVNAALPELEALPDSEYKDLLAAWARYIIDRRF